MLRRSIASASRLVLKIFNKTEVLKKKDQAFNEICLSGMTLVQEY
jgi:hypothetical protein